MSERAPEWQVVVNQRGQYALWPAWRELPAGWQACGVAGDKDECLDAVRRLWPEGPTPGRSA